MFRNAEQPARKIARCSLKRMKMTGRANDPVRVRGRRGSGRALVKIENRLVERWSRNARSSTPVIPRLLRGHAAGEMRFKQAARARSLKIIRAPPPRGELARMSGCERARERVNSVRAVLNVRGASEP